MRVSWHRTKEAANKAADRLRRKHSHDSYSVVWYLTTNRYEVFRGFTCHCRACRMMAAL